MSAWRQLLIPGLALTGLWWLLSGGAPGSWLVGLPAVALALYAVRRSARAGRSRLSPVGLLRLLPFFVAESVRGGLDVARRILAPSLRVTPGPASYRVRLQSHEARLLFVNCVSLLPGTVAADLERDRLRLHLLDTGSDPEQELRRLERVVARVFPETVEQR